jgi:shikimate kinase
MMRYQSFGLDNELSKANSLKMQGGLFRQGHCHANAFSGKLKMTTKQDFASTAVAAELDMIPAKILSPTRVLTGPDMRSNIASHLGDRLIVLVGMMASGKTSVGKLLAQRIGIPFVDADQEIETAAQMTVPEIFQTHGEAYFRDGERRVIARILRHGPRVLATGGGAYMNEDTRSVIAARGVSIWLKADAETLLRRARRRANRPLLQNGDPETVIKQLMEVRYPIYAIANMTIESRDGPHEATVDDVIATLMDHFGQSGIKA